MSLLDTFLPTPHMVLHLGNVALAVVWLCAAALLAAFVCRRRSAPVRHGILLLGLVLVLTSPPLVWLAGQAGVGRLRVALYEQRESIDMPNVALDTHHLIVDTRQEPLAMEREAEWERPAFVAERTTIVPNEPVEAAQSPRTESVPLIDQVTSTTEPTSAPTTPWWWPIAQGFVLVWTLGTAITLLWLVRSFVRLAAFCRELREHPDDGMLQVVAQAAAQVGLAHAPRLLVSAQAVMPVTLGLFRPAIVLPEGFAEDLPPDQCRAVLLHEVAHVARRDSWVGLAQRLATVLYWWCPLVYWLNRRLADLREEVCDNYVLRSQGDGASFAEVLVTLAERVVKPSPLPATVSVFEHHPARARSHALEHRIRRLLSTETNPMTRMNRVGIVLVALAGLGMAVVISLTHVSAAEADAPAAEGNVTISLAPSATTPSASQDDPVADAPADPAAPTGAGEADSEQAKVIAEIESLGGRVWRDENHPGRPVTDLALYQNKYTDALLERLKVFDNLQFLALTQTQIAESDVTRLEGLSHLQTLILVRMSVSNAFLDSLQELPQLAELHLAISEVSDANLEHIAKLPRLKALSFRNTPVTDSGLRHLAALTQLEGLTLSYTPVTDAGLEHLSRLPRLQRLDLRGTRVTDAGLTHLARLSQLHDLQLGGTQVTDVGLKHLNKFTQLTGLNLNSTKVTDAGLQHLRGLTQLTSLDLGRTQVTDAGLVHLRGMTHLERLDPGGLITGAGLEHLSELTQLAELNLHAKDVTGAGLQHLGGLTQLTRLNLRGSGITDAGLENLSGLTELRNLDLDGTKITEAGLKHVSGLRRLEELKLPKIPLSDTGLAYLEGLSQLRDLDLRGGNATDQGLRHLRGLSQLEGLGLADTKITDAGLAHLRGLTRLKRLALARTKVSDAGLVHLRGLTQLLNLDVAETQVTDDGLAHLRGLTQLAVLFEKDRETNRQLREAKTVNALLNETQFLFAETPLADVVAFLKRQHGIPIEIDRQSLAAAGIRPDVRCTLDVKDVPLGSALRKLLGDVGLTYVVDDEFILITAPKKASSAEGN